MTTYQKELRRQIDAHFGQLTSAQLLDKLAEIGLLDYTLCKVLAVREFVDTLIKSGSKKIDAMWIASEKFACTYEYVRKCMYYYTDIHF